MSEPTELYEILERFAPILDDSDLSDLSRMCREYAVNVHESRLSPPTGLTRLSENLEGEFYPDNGRYYVLRAPFTIDIERDKESYGDGSKWIAPAKLLADLT